MANVSTLLLRSFSQDASSDGVWGEISLKSYPKPPTNSTTLDWDLSHTFCGTSQSKRQLFSGRQELRPSSGRDRCIGHRSSPEQEAEEMENHYEEESASKFPGNAFETEVGIHRSGQRRGSMCQNRRPCKLICTLNNTGQDICRSPNNANAESRLPNGSQATLYISTGLKGTWKKVSITVCSQMGSLGISIAGGKGSTPYKINPEGIIISKVSKGGPADLAGLRVGDIMLEVNGISLQNVTHCEAVNTLRNSGTVIKILILRFRAVCPDTTATSNLSSSDAPPDCTELYHNEESQPEGVSLKKMTCNGNNLKSAPSGNRPVNFSSGTPQKRTSFRIMNHTMPLPQIILTHPSTSDEELEQLTFEKDEYCTEKSENPDGNNFSDYLNSAFYPP